jgi:hypothetical protein
VADKAGLRWIGFALASVAASVLLIAATLTYKSAGSRWADQLAPRQAQYVAVMPRI